MNKKIGAMPHVFILVLICLLSACGNKGDLYIPKTPEETTTKEKTKETKSQTSGETGNADATPSTKADAIS